MTIQLSREEVVDAIADYVKKHFNKETEAIEVLGHTFFGKYGFDGIEVHIKGEKTKYEK